MCLRREAQGVQPIMIPESHPLQQLFEDLLTYRPEVRVELEFIEVTRSELTSIGLQLPTSFSLIPLTTELHNVPSLATGLHYLLTFGGGASLFGIGVADATLVATYNKSNARTLCSSALDTYSVFPLGESAIP